MGYLSSLLIASGLLLTTFFAEAARRASEDLRHDAARIASPALNCKKIRRWEKLPLRQKRNGTDLVTGFEQFQFCGLCPRISQCLVDQVQRR